MTDPRHGGIAEFRGRIAPFAETGVVEPSAVYPGWTSFVSHAAVRALTVAPRSETLWVATWGGVIAWNRRDDHLYRRFSSEHGLAGPAATICVDATDRPWVGHDEGGVSVFDGERWHSLGALR